MGGEGVVGGKEYKFNPPNSRVGGETAAKNVFHAHLLLRSLDFWIVTFHNETSSDRNYTLNP